MPDTITLVTPDHVELEVQLAGPGTRASAAIVDHIIQAALLVGVFAAGFGADLLRPEASGLATALAILASFAVVFLYFVVFEWLWNGQTPGKKLGGLRAMRDDGRPLDLSAAVVRNIVRIVDFLPFGYGVGLLAAFFSPQLKRLGDLAAGTVVVVEQTAARHGDAAHASPLPIAAGLFPMLDKADREAAVRFLARRPELGLDMRRQLAQRIAGLLAEKAGIDREAALRDPEGFLEQVAGSE